LHKNAKKFLSSYVVEETSSISDGMTNNFVSTKMTNKNEDAGDLKKMA
jgi:hypothetical protein